MKHEDAIDLWSKVMTGRLLLTDLGSQQEQVETQIADDGISIVLTCPEPGPAINCLARVLQENIIMLHELGRTFNIGLLFNIHRLPLKEDMKEDVMFGLQLCPCNFLDPHFWPLIDSVNVLTGARPGQFGCFKPFPRAMQRHSNYGCIVFSSQNEAAKQCIYNLKSQKRVDQALHEGMSWGCHKSDISWLETQVDAKEKNNTGYLLDHRLPLWRHLPLKFPSCQLTEDVFYTIVYDDPIYGVSVRISMDIFMKPWKQPKITDEMITGLINTWARDGAPSCEAVDVCFNKSFRLSFASGTKPHKSFDSEEIRGVDITVRGPYVKP